MLGTTAAIGVASGATATILGPARLARWLVTPGALVWLVVANLILAGLRLYALLDAGRGANRRTAGLIAGLAVVAVLVPHGVVAWGQIRTYEFLTSVFSAPPSPAPTTSITSNPRPTPTTRREATTSTVPPTTLPDPWQGRQRLNVLILGGDAGPGRTGIRTDTVILASVGIDDGQVALFGFPRNLTDLVFADGSPFTGYQGILNEVYAFGLDHPERFDGFDPGAEAVEQVVEGLSGLQVDYFVLVDLQAFVDVVDALGGVTLYVPEEVVDPIYPKEDGTTVSIRIEKGVQTLDGTRALAYVRIRRYSNDYDRMNRQRCFLAAVAAQVDPPRLLRALPSLLDTIERNVTTDIPLDRLPDLVELATRVRAGEALSVGFGPPDWNRGFSERGFPIPDVDRIRAAVSLAIDDPAAARREYGLGEAGEVCGFGDDPTKPPPAATTSTTMEPVTGA